MITLVLVLIFVSVGSSSGIGRVGYKIDNGFSSSFSNYPSRNIFLEKSVDSHPSVNLTAPGSSRLRIVHGQAAVRGQFCYQAYLQFTDGEMFWSCGGSLVTASTILTAAHCVKGAKSATVVLGGADLRHYEAGRVVVSVPTSGLKVHEAYDEENFYNDIALVVLSKPVRLTKYIYTVKLPSCSLDNLATTSGNGNRYTVSGWGKTSDNTLTYRLMYVNVSGEVQSSCASYYQTNADYRITESQMCTSGAEGKSTCNGDSGGPLVQVDTSGNFIQQGIVSLGISSCELSAPSVYTNINFFNDWLCALFSQ